jgi:GxxExxY protein
MLLDRENILTRQIIGCCFTTHNKLGPGFDEKTYHKALIQVLKQNLIDFETEKTYPIFFEHIKIGLKRLDLIIEGKIIIEIKAVKGYLPDIYQQQLISYLKLTNIRVGLLVNFGNTRCTVKRYLNDSPIRAIR